MPILAVLLATAAFAFVAERGWPSFPDGVCLIGAMFGAQLAIGAVNELVDADLDAVAKPDKPIPAGIVSLRGARIVLLAGLLMMVLFSLRFSFAAFVVRPGRRGRHRLQPLVQTHHLGMGALPDRVAIDSDLGLECIGQVDPACSPSTRSAPPQSYRSRSRSRSPIWRQIARPGYGHWPWRSARIGHTSLVGEPCCWRRALPR
ncbi:MAG: UbiA family prenyltransferase [Thermomicrobiales bacterium]